MKKLMIIATLCLAGVAFAQEPEAPKACPCAGECACGKGPACDCAQPAAEAPKPPEGKDFRQRGPRRPMPKFKKCECCPDCKGVILPERPPRGERGEFKGSRGERGEFKGPRGERPAFKGPRGPKPEAAKGCACAGECACGKGPACDCPPPAPAEAPAPAPAEE